MRYFYFYLFFVFFSHVVFADDVPDDFMEMYQYKETEVTVTNVEDKQVQLTVLANYNTIKIKSGKSELEFRNYLKASRVKEKTIDAIITSLENEGIENSTLCIGKISECAVNSQNYDFLYDFDNKKLHLYFSPLVLIDNENTRSYVSNKNKNPTLINHVDAYLSADTNSHLLSINDLTSVGLKYGYLSSDITASVNDESSDEFDVNKLSYNIDFNSYLLQIGYFDNNIITNATDILFDKDNTKDLSVNFGTSKNLLKNSDNYYRRVYFYAPSAGSMTVYKDGRIIKQYTVSAGSGSIPYTDLPSGRYDIRIEIISNGVVSLDQLYAIYNTGSNSLNPKESSFLFSAGVYKESSYISYRNPEDNFDNYQGDEVDEHQEDSGEKIYARDFDNSLFLKGLYSYQVNHEILLGTGITATKDNNYVGKLGSKLMLPQNSDVTVLYSYYNQGSRSKTFNLNTPWFGLNYEDYNHNEDDAFSEYLQGSSSRETLTLNTNYNIFSNLSGQSGYTYGSTDGYQYRTINTSLDYQFSGGNLVNVNLMYTGAGQQKDLDGLELTVNFTIPLGSNLTATSSLYTSGNKVSQLTNGLETADLIDNDNQSLQVKVAQSNYSDSAISEVSTNGNVSNEYYNSTVYAYADTSGDRYINAGFSSSQVITDQGVMATNKKADSYLLLNVDAESENIDNLGLFSLKRNERSSTSSFIYNGQTLLPLDIYESYQGDIDTESVSLENHGDKNFSGFSFPGSIYQMNEKVGKIITFVATFDDLFSNTVEDIDCKGEGCVDISPISDGVFQVAVREGQEFILQSHDMVCLTPGVKNIKSLNLGQNHCVPYIEDDSDTEFRLVDKEGIDKPVYYIGKFKNTTESKKAYSYLNKNPYKLIEKKIEDDLLVYVTVDDGYKITKRDKTLFNNILMTADNDSRFGVPVVLVLDDTWR